MNNIGRRCENCRYLKSAFSNDGSCFMYREIPTQLYKEARECGYFIQKSENQKSYSDILNGWKSDLAG